MTFRYNNYHFEKLLATKVSVEQLNIQKIKILASIFFPLYFFARVDVFVRSFECIFKRLNALLIFSCGPTRTPLLTVQLLTLLTNICTQKKTIINSNFNACRNQIQNFLQTFFFFYFFCSNVLRSEIL